MYFDESPELLTTQQVMDILVADANLRRHAATCVLQGVFVDGQTHFRRRDLETWIKLQRAIGARES